MVIETEADVLRVIRKNPRIVFRALYEDPELLGEVRRLILTEELLAVPGQLAEVIERQDRMEGQLADVVNTQNEMLAVQSSTLADIEDIKATQSSMLTTQNRMVDQIGQLRGAELERRVARFLPSRLNPMYNLYRPAVVQRVGEQTPYSEQFFHAVEDAELASTISETQRYRIQETDMIVRAQRRDGPGVMHIAVEASATIRENDITRANDSAVALRAVFGGETAAGVAGYDIRSEDRGRADNMGVAVVILDDPW